MSGSPAIERGRPRGGRKGLSDAKLDYRAIAYGILPEGRDPKGAQVMEE